MPEIIDADGRPIYPVEVQTELDSIDAGYRAQKATLVAEHNILGARVRGGEIPESALRAYEAQAFDPQVRTLSKARSKSTLRILKEHGII
jgi:hypothetical protein